MGKDIVTNNDIKQYENLVHSIVDRYIKRLLEYKTYIEYDELRQVGMIALYNCIKKYDKSKGDLKNYIITAVKRALWRQVNFDKKIEYNTGLENYNKTYELDDTELNNKLLKEKIYTIIDELPISDKNKTILRMRLANKTLKEISDKFGISFQAVSFTIKRLLPKIYMQLIDKEI